MLDAKIKEFIARCDGLKTEFDKECKGLRADIEKLNDENIVLKKVISEQQKFLEKVRPLKKH